MSYTEIITPTKIEENKLIDFKKSLTGILLQPKDEAYNDARKIWNGMIDKKPLLIVQCKHENDVVQAVHFARKNNLLISVRAGGHNISGNAVCEGGLMIDLSQMRSVSVDPEKQVAYAEAGATWGDFDKATQEHGLATTGGLISTTGVAGLTLGGGVGWLVRKHGLSCDNLLEVKMVTADGNKISASLEENRELFWGIRGGGGNFGVVTSLTFQLHKVEGVLGGMILYPQEKAKEVLQFYREFVRNAPDALTLYCGLMTSPDGMPVIAMIGCYSGNLEEGERVIKPIREFDTPLADLFQVMPYVAMQTLLDGAFAHGSRYYWKSNFLTDIPDEAIDVIIAHARTVTSPHAATILEYYGGASRHEPEGGTAYPHRQAQFDLVIASGWDSSEEDQKHISWVREFWEDMQTYSSNRVYVNLLGIEGEDRVRDAYGEHYDRLVSLKNRYDPLNIFRLNQNIAPTAS